MARTVRVFLVFLFLTVPVVGVCSGKEAKELLSYRVSMAISPQKSFFLLHSTERDIDPVIAYQQQLFSDISELSQKVLFYSYIPQNIFPAVDRVVLVVYHSSGAIDIFPDVLDQLNFSRRQNIFHGKNSFEVMIRQYQKNKIQVARLERDAGEIGNVHELAQRKQQLRELKDKNVALEQEVQLLNSDMQRARAERSSGKSIRYERELQNVLDELTRGSARSSEEYLSDRDIQELQDIFPRLHQIDIAALEAERDFLKSKRESMRKRLQNSHQP